MMLFWGKRSMPLVQLFRKICPLQWNHKGRLVSSEKVFKLVWHSKSNYMTIRSMNLCCGTAEECLSRANRNYLTTWVLKKKRKKKNYFFPRFKIASFYLCLCYYTWVRPLHCKNPAYFHEDVDHHLDSWSGTWNVSSQSEGEREACPIDSHGYL